MASTPIYNANNAWLRAIIYFSICWLIAYFSGALARLAAQPFVSADQRADSGWLPLTILCWLIILVGYGLIWPRGTLTHGRPRQLGAIVIFGLFWGLSEGLLFVSVWHLVSSWLSNGWPVVLVTFVILATFVGLWHAFYWDIYVAPEHNIEEWNLRKVILAHIPNLLVTLFYLTLFENMLMFVMLQATALFLSTYFMHFPAPKIGRS